MLTKDARRSNGAPTLVRKPLRTSPQTSPVAQVDTQESFFEIGIRLVRKHCWLLLLGVFISTGVAYGFAELGAKTKATVKARAMYVPLPKLPGSDSFHAPDINTVVGIIRSSKCLSQLAEQHGLPSANPLSRALRVTTDKNSPFIDLSLNWNQREEGAQLINDAVQVASKELTVQTRKTLDQYMQVTEASVRSADVLVEEARTALATFYTDNPSVLDSDDSVTPALTDTAIRRKQSLATQISNAQLREANLIAQERLIADQLAHLQTNLKKDLLVACTQQIESIRSLTADTPVATAHVDKLAAKFAAMENSEPDDFDAWKTSLVSLIRRNFGSSAVDIEAQVQLAEKKLEALVTQREKLAIDGALAGAELANLQRHAGIEGQNLASQTATSSNAAGDPVATSPNADHEVLKSNLAMKVRSRGVMADRLNVLKELQQSKHVGLSILEPATPAAATEKSSWNKIFALAFTSGIALLSCSVLIYEDRTGNANASKAAALRLGLPTLGSLSRRSPGVECNRLFGLRLRRTLQGSHTVVLFCNVGRKSGDLTEYLHSLALCLAAGGDRVLVVNATEGAAIDDEPPQTLGGVIPDRTDNDLVDQIVISPETPWANSFRLDSTSVVDHLRDGYDFVLVAGPDLQAAADVELLSATSDALCLCTRSQRYVDPSKRQTIAELGQTVALPGLVQLL